jgi:hypothetical protein
VCSSDLEPPADPFCPRPMADNRNDQLWQAVWSEMKGLILQRHGLEPGSKLTEMEPTVRVVATGDGTVAIAAAYGIDRFSLWRRGLTEREWAAARARVDANARRLHVQCLAHPPADVPNPEEECARWLEPGDFDYEVVEKIWRGVSPGLPIGDCIADGLEVAMFTGRLDAQGGLDPAALRLTGTVTVETNSSCNPEASRFGAQLVDVDHDGKLEFVFLTGASENDYDLWARPPIDLHVVRLDATVQHHQLFPGVVGSPMESWKGPQLDFWFEDRTEDGYPDLVIETFTYVGECDEDPAPSRSLTGCVSNEQPDPDAPAMADHPQCTRREDEIELRRVYDLDKDGWLAERAAGMLSLPNIGSRRDHDAPRPSPRDVLETLAVLNCGTTRVGCRSEFPSQGEGGA